MAFSYNCVSLEAILLFSVTVYCNVVVVLIVLEAFVILLKCALCVERST